MARTREAGFSLIELMLVGALVAVMAGISVPTIAGAMQRYTVISASQQVVSTIRGARVQSVGKNRVLKVHFELAAGTFQVLDADDNPVGDLFTLPAGVKFDAATADVEFDTAGRVDPAVAPVTIVVSNDAEDDQRTITVTTSGRVQLP